MKSDIVGLDKNLVPEAAMGMALQRASSLAMFEMRGYVLIEEKTFLEGGRKYMAWNTGQAAPDRRALAPPIGVRIGC